MRTRLASQLTAWDTLRAHHQQMASVHMRDLFADDPGRFDRFSVEACGLFLDFSKNRIIDDTLTALLALAEEAQLAQWVERLFAGEKVNNTEDRAALHVALRYRSPGSFPSVNYDVMPEVRDVLARMRRFADSVTQGAWVGYTGKPVRAIVNIGIGGSDLGPAMVCRALSPYAQGGMKGYFVSNLDSTQLTGVLNELDPQTTLFIVASKTFTTQETLTNARSARDWLVAKAGEQAVAKHFAAVSTRPDRTSEFGIDPGNVFEFWDWVGGRYSLWSAIGLSIATLIGMDRFEELLAGGHDMDQHFRSAPWSQNMPVLLGLLGIWYRDFFLAQTQVVLPYDYALRDFPDYLQQLEMESNGKRVSRAGEPLDYPTGAIIWGGPGNNGQHAFYQLMHQGTVLVPADFIVPMRSQYPMPGHEEAMLSNALAQAEALMRGRPEDAARAAAAAAGFSGESLEAHFPHRVLPGNQPTNTLVYERLTPRVLGALIALYEHKVFVQSVCWGINPFDQWGVELGKEMAAVILPELQSAGPVSGHDASTNGLIRYIKQHRGA
ncbi:MAG: glucose-6-phosphate isomerase [Gammaproteobacteria bacterium]